MAYRFAFNVIAFQIGWLACVLAGAYQQPWLGTLLVLGLVAVHLATVPFPARELGLILLCGLVGAVWDSMLVALGLTAYPSGVVIDDTAPYWIVALWMLFATTLNVSLRWLRGRWLLAALLGSTAGPLSFYAGHRLGGVAFADPVHSLTVLGLGWAVLMPLLLWLAGRLDGLGHTNAMLAGPSKPGLTNPAGIQNSSTP